MDGSSGCRALVVEDDEASLFVLTRLLQTLGVTVCPVRTLAEAHANLDGQDVVFLDFNLPDGLGTGLLERIRREGRRAKVALTTASAITPSFEKALRVKPDIFLPKPIDYATLMRWLYAERLIARRCDDERQVKQD